MATSKNYLSYILEQLSLLKNVTYRNMMGEYIIYIDSKIAAYLCDDRLLVKPTKKALEILKDSPLEEPYPNAKKMILVENVDNKEFLLNLFTSIID